MQRNSQSRCNCLIRFLVGGRYADQIFDLLFCVWAGSYYLNFGWAGFLFYLDTLGL